MAEPGSGWEDVCWICLASSTEGPSTPLVYPCACPRPVHETCLAKWQLHRAGREEESCCRFCKQPLPHWRQAFRPRTSSSSGNVVSPLMSIQFHGQTYWLQVQTGEGGVQQFQADVKRLLDLNSEDDFDITFECQVPGEGGKLELHGLQAFDAAVYCASLTASERMQAAGGSTGMQEGQDPSGSSTAADAAEAADAPPGTPRCSHSTAEPRSARDRRRSSSGSESLLGGGASSNRSSSWGRASSSSGSSSSGASRAGSDSGSSMFGVQPSMQPSSSSGGYRSELDQQQQQGSRRQDGTDAADSSAGDSVGGALVTSEGMVRMGVQGLWEVASRAWSWLSSKSNVH